LKTLNARLTALTDANKLLAEEAWVTPRVDVVVQRSLAPFEGSAERIRAEGPALNIEPSAAVALALTLHELATNAIKYGSLSTDKGSVRLHWQIDATGNFELRWTEADGPRVGEPNPRGFGTELMRRVWQGLGGSVRLRLSENGLKALFCAPRERIETIEA
jgi:two-component sensor histidine kinase